MGKSFFRGTDAELYTGSDNFSTKITASPSSYGISVSQAAAYAALNLPWRAAYLTATTPETRTKASIAAKNAARAPLRVMASDLAKIIDGTPSVTDAQKIELGLNVRATPSPAPAPGTPFGFKVELIPADGSVVLTWKCNNSRRGEGVLYAMARKVDDATEWFGLGNVGERKFTDSTIPAGTTSVTYRIQAQRTTSQGTPATFTIAFGGGAGVGATIASVTPGPKIAA